MQATDDPSADFGALRRSVGAAADAARTRRRAGLHAVFRPGPATPARRPAARRSPQPLAALRRAICGPTSKRTAECFHDDTGDPALTLDMYEDGDHLAASGARPLHRDPLRPAAAALSVIFHSLDFVVFFLAIAAIYWALPHRAQNLLLLVAQLLLLRLRASVVPDADRDVDGDRLLRRAAAWSAGRAAGAASSALSIVTNFGMLGFFKYFNFFVENVHAALAALGVSAGMPALQRDPAGRHLVLHVPGDELHDRRLSRRAARPPQPARRRGVRVVLPAPGRRPDSAGLVPAAAGRGRRGASTSRRRGAGCLLICWGFFKKLVIADNVGVDRQQGVRARRPVVLAAVVWRVRVRDADLRGLLGLHRHRARDVAVAGVRADRELRSPVSGALARRTSGGAGTSRSRPGSATTSTSRSAARAPARAVGASMCWSTFLLSGLWHGASWNYVLWGLYHGLLLVLTRVGSRLAAVQQRSRGPGSRFRRWSGPSC